jgi:error-prone DNA polymerase
VTLAYAELDVVSNFSFLRGASHPDELVNQAAELGYAAVGMTDVNSLAGIVRAHQAAKEAGIRLCVGARLRFSDAPDVLAWVENRAGYANLCRLLTAGKRRAEKGACILRLDDLLAASDGLLAALTARSIDPESPAVELQTAAQAMKEAMGDRLSLAVSRVQDGFDRACFRRAQAVGWTCGIPLLATNQAHYHISRRRMLQDVLTCVRHGCTIHQAGFQLFSNGERFLKTPLEMQHLFYDEPAALARTVEIAQRCGFSLDELRYEYPDEIVPPGKTPAQYLGELAWAGAANRYPAGVPPKVRGQIEHELRLIEQLNVAAYFLTVYDLVRFARSRGILCQGRGSAANSAVCYCIGVTSVDPDRVDVLFERFISTARNEPPDIDIDFEHERREEVIQYVYEKYGRERAAMTAEVITYRARSAVRDVGKAMGLGLDTVDQMAKRQDWWDRGVLNDAKIREVGLDPADRTVRMTLQLAGELLGFPRHLSQHVGGMVMSRRPLCESVPIENATMNDRTVIEWDKDDLDAVGMFKVDVLALGMLTCLSKAFKLLNGRHEGTEARRHEGVETYKGDDYGADSDVSGFDCVAIGDEIGSGDLSGDSADAENGAIRTDQSDAKGRGVGSVECRGGVCPTEHVRLSQTSADCTGIPGRIIDPVRAFHRSENADRDDSSLRSSVRNGPSPAGTDSKRGSDIAQITNAAPPPSCLRASAEALPSRVPSCLALHTIPPEDPAVYAMASDADTVGVFQIESRAQMSMLPRLRPRCFYDLVIEVAIVRPGPIQGNMVHPYLRRRDGIEPVSFPKPELEAVLGKTLGVPLFQEQAMKVAMVAAGFSAAEADQLRRAMAAWRYVGRIEKFQRKMIDGMLANGYTREFSERCFNQIKGFGEYGFPESHAASFALLVYASAWVKRYHPAAFCAAILNSQPMGFYAPAQLVRDAREHGVEVRAVDVNHSEYDCTLEEMADARGMPVDADKRTWGYGGPAVRLGFRMVKGLNAAYARRMVDCRQRHGPFGSIDQFHDVVGLPVSAVKKLAEADAFASLSKSRRPALWDALALPEVRPPLRVVVPDEDSQVCALPPMTAGEEILADYGTVGLSLKGHPVQLVRAELGRRKIIPAAEVRHRAAGQWISVAGVVLIRQRPGTASGIVFVTLEDETGVVNLIIRPAVYEQYRSAVRHAALLQADGMIERQGQVQHVMAARLHDLSDVLSGFVHPSRDFR